MEKRITKLEVILAALLLFIPLILILISGEVRESISDYVYSKHNAFFVGLLTTAGVMFVYNGAIYNKHWYNIILGCSLVGVSLTPHNELPILHYLFAGLFFFGSVATMIIFSSPAQRELKIVLGTLIVLAISCCYVARLYSLLVAEWIGILPICIHFIGESLKKFD